MSSPSTEGGPLDQLGISPEEIDLALTAQLVVAWAGERGEEKRLAWWRTDMVSEFGGEDLFQRLMPTTWRWAVLQAAREAARLTDEQLRKQADDPDRIVSLFRFGFEIDELIEERLLELKRSQPNPKAALPGLDVIQEHWDPEGEIGELEQAVTDIRAAYRAERASLLQRQEEELEAARARVKRREGFSTLTADQAHQVLRPLTEAATPTDEESIAPTLATLQDTFTLALTRAEDQADETLDRHLSEGEKPLIVKLDLGLRNRELTTEAEVDALVEEVRAKLLEKIRQGARVRLQ